jgi:hypothetical protein
VAYAATDFARLTELSITSHSNQSREWITPRVFIELIARGGHHLWILEVDDRFDGATGSSHSYNFGASRYK